MEASHVHCQSDERTLTYEQVVKLNAILNRPVELQSPSNFPTLSVTPASLVEEVRQRLDEKKVSIQSIRMNGSAASHCLCKVRESENLPPIIYNDVDIIFVVPAEYQQEDFNLIKDTVMKSLLKFFPKGISTEKLSTAILEEAYARKMVKIVTHENRWSLVSLGGGSDVSIELKFVAAMKRPFQFTVDSFQIALDSYFTLERCQKAVSMYGDYDKALEHLNDRLIHTTKPAEIHGGGLLKYCYLLARGFKPANREDMTQLEPYMCSRFFIDFQSREQQFSKILDYAQRYPELEQSQTFLDTLMDVVFRKARCLMESERQKTIDVICQVKTAICYQQFTDHFPHYGFQMSNIYSHQYPLPYNGYSSLRMQLPCSS
ncbi:hypothetical protein EMCRGX_G034710 [Ephydatia muelleri]